MDTDVGDVKEVSYENAGNDIDEDNTTDSTDTMDPIDLADNMEYQNDAQDAAESIGMDNIGDSQPDIDYFENDEMTVNTSDGTTEQTGEDSANPDGFKADIEDLNLTEAVETIEHTEQDDTAMPDVTDMQLSADNGVELTDTTSDTAATTDASVDYLGDEPVISEAAVEASPDMLSPDDLTSAEVFSPEVEVFDANTAPSTELDDLQKDNDDIDEPIMDMLDSYMSDDTPVSEPESINDLLEDYINNDLMSDSNVEDIAIPDIDTANEDTNLPEVDALSNTGDTDIASADNMNFADANDMAPDDLSIADTLDYYFDDVATDMTGLADVDTMSGLDDTLMDNNLPDTTMDNPNDFEADYSSFDDTSYDSMAD